MTSFRALGAASTAPGRVIDLPASAFNATWDERPEGGQDARVGLRLLSEIDLADCRAQAIDYAVKMTELPEARNTEYNDALMRLAVARATTAPHDVREKYFGPLADDQVGFALTTDGVRHVYEQLVNFAVAESPLTPEASDDDILCIPERLVYLDPGHVARLRRVLGYVLKSIDTLERGRSAQPAPAQSP